MNSWKNQHNSIARIIPKVLLERNTVRSRCFSALIFLEEKALIYYSTVICLGMVVASHILIFMESVYVKLVYDKGSLSVIIIPIIWLIGELLVISIVCVISFISDLKRKAWFIWHFDAIGNLIQYTFTFIVIFIVSLLLRWKLGKIDKGTEFKAISWVSIELLLIFLLICIFLKKLLWKGKNRLMLTIIFVLAKVQIILTVWKISNLNKVGFFQWSTLIIPSYAIFLLIFFLNLIGTVSNKGHFENNLVESVAIKAFGIIRASSAVILIFLLKFIANYLDGLDEKGRYFKSLYWIAVMACLVGMVPVFGEMIFSIIFDNLEVENKLHKDFIDRDYSTAFLTDSEDVNDMSRHSEENN